MNPAPKYKPQPMPRAIHYTNREGRRVCVDVIGVRSRGDAVYWLIAGGVPVSSFDAVPCTADHGGKPCGAVRVSG